MANVVLTIIGGVGTALLGQLIFMVRRTLERLASVELRLAYIEGRLSVTTRGHRHDDDGSNGGMSGPARGDREIGRG